MNDRQASVRWVARVGTRIVRLSIAPRVMPGETVTLGYTRPSSTGAGTIQDTDRVPAESFAAAGVDNVTPANQAATGAPDITGTARVGETLTAGLGTIDDGNGLTDTHNVRYRYRWVRAGSDGDADIAGAIAETYTVSADDIGKRLKVRVEFEDDARYAEARTSEATGVVPDTVAPRLAGGGAGVTGAALTLRFDEALDTASEPAASAFSVSVAGSTATVSAVAVSGDTVTLTLASAVSRGQAVTLGYTVPAVNPIRDIAGNDAGSLSAVSVANRTTSLPGAPQALGSRPLDDNSLAFDWQAPADDGGADVSGYQHRFSQGNTVATDAAWTDVTGRSASFGGLRSGTAYSLEVRAVNRLGAGPAVSGTGTTSGPTDHPATGAPTIGGTIAVRRTLTASTTTIDDGNGVTAASYGYQWLRLDAGAWEEIRGAASSAYRVELADVGKRLAVRVDFTDDGGFAETLTSTATIAVPDAENAPPTSRDATIVVVEDGSILIPASDFHFADEDAGHALARIRLETLPDAGALEYFESRQPSTPVAATAGMEIEVDQFGGLTRTLRYRPAANGHGRAYARFTFKVHDGTGYSADSYTMTIDVTGAPDDPAGAPEVGGTAKLGETLTADLDDISDPDGLENATYAYRWFRITVNPDTRTAIAGADAASYTPVAADVGAQVAVEVTFTDDGGTEHTLASAAYPANGAIAGNDLPTSANSAVETDEDTDYTFAASDFPFADSDGGSLASVTIATLPASGRLAFDGAGATAGQAVAAADLGRGKLVYEPADDANGNGVASFTFSVSDGESDSETIYTMRIDVAAVNDAPDGADRVVTIAEDTTHVFGAADFGFVDVDGDSLAGVTVVTLPAKGSLTLAGANAGDPPVAVTANQAIARARLDAGALKFTPAANGNGSAYAAFTFRVSDGTVLSAASRRLTVDVTAVEDAPEAADSTVTAVEGVEYAFSLADFNFADADGDSLDSVLIATPLARGTGVLRLRGATVTAGGRIPAGDIAGGRLTYLWAGDTAGAGLASFSFRVAANGAESAARYTMTIDVTGVDDPATGEVLIAGKAVVGRTLTADTRFVRDPDGLTGATFGYTWTRTDGEEETEVGTAAGYTVAAGDLDRTLELSVTFTDDGGTTTEMVAVSDPVVNNSAPEAYGSGIILDEDTIHVFAALDFPFWDQDRDPLTEVTIVTLPAEGTGVVTLGGAGPDDPAQTVTAGQAIPAADIEAGRLKYAPPTNANGGYDPYARFTYRVSDGLAESNSGEMSITVNPVNDPATGAPAIAGTFVVGETLTANTSRIRDADGLSSPDYRFEWYRVDEEGSVDEYVGSERTYTITLDDAGRRLRVLAWFFDDAGQYEELRSEPSGVIGRSAAANNAPTSRDRTITTGEDVAHTFAQVDFAFSDQDHVDRLESVTVVTLPGKGALTLDSGSSGTSAAPVSVGDAVPATDIFAGRLKFVPAANENGEPYTSFTFKVSDGISESAGHTMTVRVFAVNDPNSTSGSPVISGTARLGETLTVDMTGITDVDGLDESVAVVYAWIRVDGGDETVIAGATGSSYTPAGDDVDKDIKVRVTVHDIHFESAELTSDPVAVADNTAPAAADGTVTATEDTERTFTTGDFGYSDADGDALAGVRIVTLPASGKGSLLLDGGAVAAGDLVSAADIGASKLAYAPPANAHGAGHASFTFKVSDGIYESAAVNTITIDVTAVDDPASGLAIAGTPREGLVLTADVNAVADDDGLSSPGYGYRWVRVATGGTETELGTASTYRLVSADVGNTVRLEVSLTDDDGNTPTLTARTGTVAANSAPTASNGTVTTANDTAYVFTAGDFGYSDAEGDALAGVRIVTLPASGKGSLLLDAGAVAANDVVPAADIGASKLTYAPPANSRGADYASFTFKVSDGISESAAANTITIDVTAAPGVPTGLAATRGDASVTLAWAAPADTGSSAIVKYQYRVSDDGGASWAVGWTDVPDGDDAGADLHDETSFTVPDLDNDTAYAIELRAVNAAGSGAEARATAQAVAAQGAAALPLTLGTIAGDDVVNIAEKALGFLVSGTTGTVSGASVTVSVGATELSATSRANGAWSVLVPVDASYIAGESVTVTVAATHWRHADAATLTRSLGVDLAAPAVRSASVDGASLTVTFGEDLGEAASLANTAFSVRKTPAGGSEETVALSGDDAPVIDGATVTLTLASAAASTDSDIEVSYRKPESGSDNKLADGAGNEAASFADRAVTNDTSDPAPGVTLAGTPAITTPNVFRVPAKLGVDLSSVTGAEGLDDVSYRWIRVGAGGASNPVNVGTGATYTLADADAGKRITVEVSYGNARGESASAGSAAYPSGGSVGGRESCSAPVLSGGAELIGAGRRLSVEAYGNGDGRFWGYYTGRTLDFGELDGAAFSIDGTRHELKAVASADRRADGEALYVVLDKALSADHRRKLTLHDCGWTYPFRNATKHDVLAQYRWPLESSMSESAERTIYLSRDVAAPTVGSAVVNGATLVLTFGEALDEASEPAASAFAVTVGADARAVEAVEVAGTTVTLTLASAVAEEDTVTVAYTAPAAPAAALRDAAGNRAAGFAGSQAANETPPPLPVVSIAAAATPVSEGAAAAFTLSRTEAPDAGLTVAVSVSESGAAVSGTPPVQVTFAAGSAMATLGVATRDDEAVEVASTVTATVSPGTGYTVDAESGSAGVVVEDDDAAPQVTTAPPIVVAENATAVATLTATDADTAAGNLSWSIPAGAAGGDDAAKFALTAEGVLTLRSAKDYDAPDDANTDGEYEVTVRVTDGSNPVDTALVVRLAGGPPPRVTAVSVTSDPGADRQWENGDRVEIQVRFSEAVTVDVSRGTPALKFWTYSVAHRAAYSGGSGTSTLTFVWTVSREGTRGGSASRALVAENGLVLNGATIRDEEGLDAELSFAVTPAIASLEIAAPAAGEPWATGTSVTVTLSFNTSVVVDTGSGTPGLGLRLAAGARQAPYAGGTGTRSLSFAYPVTESDGDVRLVQVPGNPIALNGGTIRNRSGTDADLSFQGPISWTSAPDRTGIAVDDARAVEGQDETITFRVRLAPAQSAPVSVSWATADGTATAGQDYSASQDTITFAPGETEKTIEVDILDDAHDEREETFTVRLSNATPAYLAAGAESPGRRRRGPSSTPTRCRRRGLRASGARWRSRSSTRWKAGSPRRARRGPR